MKCLYREYQAGGDIDKTVGLVWAIDELHLPNVLMPRNCPRVTYHVGKNTTDADKEKFFSSPTMSYGIVLENGWLRKMQSTSIYAYEFNTADFCIQDDNAGYYVAQAVQVPIAKYKFDNLFEELIKRNVEIRIADNLWQIADKVQASTLNWSLCRMDFAQPRI